MATNERVKNLLEKHGLSGVNKPKKTPSHPTKKGVVLAKDGDKVKLVRFGQQGAQDFTMHKNEKRRASYRARHGAIKDKSGKPAIKNKLSAAYWSWKKW
jgi:hypothetical protein